MKDGQLIDDNDDMIAEREIFNKIHSQTELKHPWDLAILDNYYRNIVISIKKDKIAISQYRYIDKKR